MSFFVDLTLAPYAVVPDDPTKGAQNTSGINAAIAAYNGMNAVLMLPPGDIYCERATSYWSLRMFEVSRLTLRGMGMFATTLVQQGTGIADAEWDLLVIDGSEDIEVAHLGLRQGTIMNPDLPGDHHALINLFSNTRMCRNLVFQNLYFGPCIGDAFRVVGTADDEKMIENVRLTQFLMETGGHPQGAGGLQQGSRSGVSMQRGFRSVEIGNGFIQGAKNSPFEMEPTGAGINDDLLVHDLIVDNSGGRTRLAFTVAGTLENPLTGFALDNVTVLEGAVQCAHTVGMLCINLQIRTTGAAPSDLANASLFFLDQDNRDAMISSLHLVRGPGSPAGPLVTVMPGRQATGTITPVAGSALVDGETFTLSDGVLGHVFELDSNGSVAGGHVPVAFTAGDTPSQVRDAIAAAINGPGLGLELSATPTTTGSPARPAVLLTNKHHGKHGNVAIAETVADPAFLVEGMARGTGNAEGVRFLGGHWISHVTAGTELRYVEARGCERLSIEGIDLELWANLTTEYGFSFRSVGDIRSPSITGCRIDARSPTFGATGNKLAAAVVFVNSNAYQLQDIRVDGLRAPQACTVGVLLDRNGGSSLDAYPQLRDCDFTGATHAWLADHSAVGAVFPVLGGTKGGVCTMVGTVAPEGVVQGVQGCEYTRQNGDLTSKHFKSTGTGATGWSPVAIP